MNSECREGKGFVWEVTGDDLLLWTLGWNDVLLPRSACSFQTPGQSVNRGDWMEFDSLAATNLATSRCRWQAVKARMCPNKSRPFMVEIKDRYRSPNATTRIVTGKVQEYCSNQYVCVCWSADVGGVTMKSSILGRNWFENLPPGTELEAEIFLDDRFLEGRRTDDFHTAWLAYRVRSVDKNRLLKEAGPVTFSPCTVAKVFDHSSFIQNKRGDKFYFSGSWFQLPYTVQGQFLSVPVC